MHNDSRTFIVQCIRATIKSFQKEFGVNACKPRIANGLLTDLGNGFVRVDTFVDLAAPPPPPTPPQYAHSFNQKMSSM